MTDSKVERPQIRYQTVEVSQFELEIRFKLEDDGFKIYGFDPFKSKFIMKRGFVIPKAPEPPRPSCLG
jgi:hypothetical protein